MSEQFIEYYSQIQNRSKLRYTLGLFARFINHFRSELNCFIARTRGAKIGSNTYIPLKLALNANSNLEIGNSSIIETTSIDLRDKIIVGDSVIINKGVVVLRASHKTDTKFFETISNPLQIKKYVWITSNSTILPGCKEIAAGSILGAGAVLRTSIVEPKSIFFGNPAVFIRYRKEVHEKLVVESLQGRDFKKYSRASNFNKG